MKEFLAIFCALFGFSANATEKQGTQIQILRGGFKPKCVLIESAPGRIVIRSKPPHRLLNSEGVISEFEGIEIKKLIGLTNKDQKSLVHFVGMDGYVSTVPASVLLKTNAILALKKNGQKLSDRQGGIQVIYPTDGNQVVDAPYAKKAAFWCWYVRSIVVGDLPKEFGNLNLKAAANGAESFSFEAPSVFQFQKTECPKTLRFPLSKLARSSVVRVHFLSGETKEFLASGYDVIMSTGKMALPVNCGGPFALLDRTKVGSLRPPVLATNLETGADLIEVQQ